MNKEHLLEYIALQIAEANNGGNWAEHYNDDQKNVWRNRAQIIINMVMQYIQNKEI